MMGSILNAIQTEDGAIVRRPYARKTAVFAPSWTARLIADGEVVITQRVIVNSADYAGPFKYAIETVYTPRPWCEFRSWTLTTFDVLPILEALADNVQRSRDAITGGTTR